MASTKKFVANNFTVDVSGLKPQAASVKHQATRATSSKPQASRRKRQAASHKQQAPESSLPHKVSQD